MNEPIAFFANSKNNQNFKKDNKGDKKVCTYCNHDGHVYEQCFERLGYPDWYKGKKNKKGVKMAAQVYGDFDYTMGRDTPFDMEYENNIMGDKKTELDQRLVAAVC